MISIILILFVSQSSANYAEIGYNGGLSIKSIVRVKSVLILQTERDRDLESIGAGIGYRIKYFRLAAIVNQTSRENFNVELKAGYYDRGIPYHIGISQDLTTKELDYKVGVGYPINEKVNLMLNYSNKRLFLGVRQWF